MPERTVAQRRIVIALVVAAAASGSALAIWPSGRDAAGYPFARRASGGAGSTLWSLSPDALGALIADDEARAERLVARLDAALALAKQEESVLSTARVDDLDAPGRARVRQVWWAFFEPMVALDELKERYEPFYGIDYVKHPLLHARAYALAFSALCAQASAGHDFVELVAGRELAQKLFDEKMPDLGLPSGTFSALRSTLGRARDFGAIPVGAEWYDRWIARHLAGEPGKRAAALVERVRARALAGLTVSAASAAAKNKTETLESLAFRGWFPIQKGAARWFGDTRVAPEGRRLISDAQLTELARQMKPGDIIIERRNWYLSNVGLPGFWPHAAMYAGTQDQIRAAFDGDEAVRQRFGTFSEHLTKKHSAAWRALGERDEGGHARVVVEAVSEGVIASSLEHSCGADYVAVLRPKLDAVDVAAALDRGLAYFGRPYDFDFDFATDDEVVCSELVMKAFEPPGAGAPGLRVPFVTVAGRRAIPPTEIVRTFATERGAPKPQLEFVYFLDGREKEKAAVVGNADALAASAERPKWDVVQP